MVHIRQSNNDEITVSCEFIPEGETVYTTCKFNTGYYYVNTEGVVCDSGGNPFEVWGDALTAIINMDMMAEAALKPANAFKLMRKILGVINDSNSADYRLD